MRVRALFAAAGLLMAGGAQAAEPTAMLQLNSGFRPLGLPLGTLLGGGLRAGLVLGPVTPFAGGSASWVRAQPKNSGDDAYVQGSLWTVQVGARVRVVELEAAETWLVGGTMLSNVGGENIWDAADHRGAGTHFPIGPGGFLGGGADAFLSERVSLAVEGGLAYASGGVISNYYYGPGDSEIDDYRGASLLFAYSTLGVTVWLGGGE